MYSDITYHQNVGDTEKVFGVFLKNTFLMEDSPIIYIQYLDSVVYDGELPLDHDFKLVVFDAVGFLIREDEEAVYLSREVNTNHGNKRRAIIGIPKVAILKRKNM